MLHLRPPAWAEGFSIKKEEDNINKASTAAAVATTTTTTSSSSSAGSSSSVSPTTLPTSPLILELVTSLTHRRLYREVALAFHSALQDARAEFSFLRLKGLKALLKLLTSLSPSDTLIHLFQDSQTDKTLQVVPVLFEHSLAPARNLVVLPTTNSLCFEEPLQVVSPPTDYEVALALRVLEGCCLLHKGSRVIASQHMAIKEVIEMLSAGGILEQGACLDALPALLLDTPINQQEFQSNQGIKKISELVKNVHVDETMRLKCAEFLFLLVGGLLPHENEEDTEMHPTAEDAVAEVHQLLGDAFLMASKEIEQATSFPNSREREHALHSQAKQLLELLDSSSW